MLLESPQSGVDNRLSARPQVFTAKYRTASAFIVLVLLLVGNGKAQQERADRINALIEQLQSSDKRDRMSATRAIVDIGPGAKATVPALINILRDRNEDLVVRSSAASAIGRIGPEAKMAVNDLITLFRDQHEDVHMRRSVTPTLGQIGPDAKAAVNDLIAALRNQHEDANVRSSAASSLGQIGSEAKAAVNDLIAVLRDRDENVRRAATIALGGIGPEAKTAVNDLIAVMLDQHENVRARSSAASSLGQIGPDAKAAVNDLIAVLRDRDENLQLRSSAVLAIGQIGHEAKAAVNDLITALKNQNEERLIQLHSAITLGLFGAESKEAIPALTAALKDQELGNLDLVARSIGEIATALSNTGNTESLVQLKAAYEALAAHQDPKVRKEAIQVKLAIESLESLWWAEMRQMIRDHHYISGGAAAYLLLQISWLLLFWFRPLSLLKVISSLSQIVEKFKIPWIDLSIPLKHVLVFRYFHYHPRLLDAWVRNHLSTARDNFARRQTVAQRKIYVATPALIDEQVCEGPSAALLQPIFDKKKVTLLISGEGGAGKTSLACQMAAWAMTDDPERRLCKTHWMLPVLIESDLPPIDGKNSLFEAIRGGLRDLIGEPEPIFGELLMRLLRRRRVLVIVDSLSEQDETTRKNVRPAHADFPVAALVVTSRVEEDLSSASKTLIRPIRLKSDRLSTFIDRYLEQLGKRDLFDDEEYFDACRKLSQLVSGREITVLVAKMYIDQMIAAKEADSGVQSADRDLPRNLPDLMLGYIKRLNDQVKADRQDIRRLVSVTKVVAWECLKLNCRPSSARREDALKALSNEPDSAALLKYAEERLQLIQSAGAISDLIRFSLDPLAEYLAALYLVERCGKSEVLWKEFFERAKAQPGAPETIKGFLLAARDCCMEKGAEFGAPDWVEDELARLSGLDPEATNAAQLKQRVRLL